MLKALYDDGKSFCTYDPFLQDYEFKLKLGIDKETGLMYKTFHSATAFGYFKKDKTTGFAIADGQEVYYKKRVEEEKTENEIENEREETEEERKEADKATEKEMYEAIFDKIAAKDKEEKVGAYDPKVKALLDDLDGTYWGQPSVKTSQHETKKVVSSKRKADIPLDRDDCLTKERIKIKKLRDILGSCMESNDRKLRVLDKKRKNLERKKVTGQQ